MEAKRANRSLDGKSQRPPFVVDSISSRGKLPAYNGLRDSNLRGYFSSKRRRKLLIQVGLVSVTQVNVKGEILSRATDPSPSRLRNKDTRNLKSKKSHPDIFHSAEPNRSAYSNSRRSQSVRVNKTMRVIGAKPVTHEELQQLFDKYRPSDVVQEVALAKEHKEEAKTDTVAGSAI